MSARARARWEVANLIACQVADIGTARVLEENPDADYAGLCLAWAPVDKECRDRQRAAYRSLGRWDRFIVRLRQAVGIPNLAQRAPLTTY